MELSKKVLIITYRYVPEIAPRVFRWSSIIREWKKSGIDVDVICASFPGTPSFEVIEKANIHRISPWFSKNQRTQLSNNLPQQRENNQNEEAKKIGNASSLKAAISEKNFSSKKNKPIRFTRVHRIYEVIYSRWKRVVNRIIPNAVKRKVKSKITKGLKRVFNRILPKRLRRKIGLQKAKHLAFLRRTQISISKEISLKIKRPLRNLVWPDYGLPWILPVVRKIRKLNSLHPYDAIITVSWPISPHVAGWIINRTSTGIPYWLVDIGDPFSYNTMTPINDFKRYGKLNRKFEESLIKNSSKVVVTTEKTKAEYEKYFPGNNEKIVVIPPIIPNNDLSKMNLQDVDSQKIMMVFTGSLRIRNRNPKVLLHLFNLLLNDSIGKDLELHFWGDVKQCTSSFIKYSNLLNNKIFLHGIVSKEEVDAAIRTSHFLINIGNLTEYQVPSKVVEYLAANKPIINFSSNRRDSSWEILSKSRMSINIFAMNIDDISSLQIQSLIKFIKSPPKPMSKRTLSRMIKPYLPERISNQYLELLNSHNRTDDNFPLDQI